MSWRFLFVWLLLAALGVLEGASGVELPPYAKVISCVPLSVTVRPKKLTDSHDYGLEIEGDAAQLQNGLHHEVDDGVLRLSLSGKVSITTPITLTVFLPDTKLEAVQNRGVAVMLVESGFDVKEIAIKAVPGRIRVDRIFANKAVIETKGAGMVVVYGTIQKVTVVAADVSKIAVKGVQRKAHVEAGGTSKVFIMGDKTKRIDGQVRNLAKVFADPSESCTITSEGHFGGGCKRLVKSDIPVIQQHPSEHVEFMGDAICGEDIDTTATSAYVHKSADESCVSASASSSSHGFSSGHSSSSSSASGHSSAYASSLSSASGRSSAYSSSSSSASAHGPSYSSSSVHVRTGGGHDHNKEETIVIT